MMKHMKKFLFVLLCVAVLACIGLFAVNAEITYTTITEFPEYDGTDPTSQAATSITTNSVYYMTANQTLNLSAAVKVTSGASLKIVNNTGTACTVNLSGAGYFWLDNGGGAAHGSLIIEGNASSPITIDGTSRTGGAVEAYGNLTCKYVTFQNCTAKSGGFDYSGGAVSLRVGIGGSLHQAVFENCQFINNSDTRGGAVAATRANAKYDIRFTNCTFTGNKALVNEQTTTDAGCGGAIYIRPGNSGATTKLTIENCTFTSNSSENLGGAIAVRDSQTNLNISSNCEFNTNSSVYSGGAIYLLANGSGYSYSIADSSFTGNSAAASSAGGGGAIYWPGHGTISDCTFTSNSAMSAVDNGASGGTLYLNPNGATTVTGCVIDGGKSGNGSAIYLQGGGGHTVTLEDSLVMNCSQPNGAKGDGGTIRCPGGNKNNLIIKGCVIRNNTTSRGGAVYWNATNETTVLTVEDTQILNNTVTCHGGAFFMEGKALNITGSGSSTPTAYTANTAPSGLTGTLIQGNSAPTSGTNIGKDIGNGGAICISTYGGDSANVIQSQYVTKLSGNVTITGNTAYNGGAVSLRVAQTDGFGEGHQFVLQIEDDVKIQSNTATNVGGALYLNNVNGPYVPKVVMSGGTISGHNVTGRGGAIYVENTTGTGQPVIEMSGGTIKGNSAAQGGAAYLKSGTFTMTGGTVGTEDAPNKSSGGGAAFYLQGGNFVMSGGTIQYNQATVTGGAFLVYESDEDAEGNKTGSTLTINNANALISNNSGLYGGGIGVEGIGVCNFSAGTITGNTATSQGAGVRITGTGTFTMTGGTISSNKAASIAITTENGEEKVTYSGHGGGVYVGGGVCNVQSGTIEKNAATVLGGGICVTGGTANVGLSSCKGTNTSHSHPYIAENVSGVTFVVNEKKYYGQGDGAGIGISGGTLNVYCCNLYYNRAEFYSHEKSASYYQTNGTLNWYGGYLGVGHVKTGGTINPQGATLYTVTYDIYDPIDSSVLTNGHKTTAQFVRGNTLTLPAGTYQAMSNKRYNQNTSGWDGQYAKKICMGWATSEDNAANSVYDYVGKSVTSATTTKYAVWKLVDDNKITYNYNGGTAGTTNPSSYTITPGAASASSITISNPTRTGYTFAGWTASGGNWSDLGTGTKVQTGGLYGSVTLTAQWTPITYTVAYNGNGATGGSTASSTHTYDTAKALTANGFTRAYTVTYNYNKGTGTPASNTATYTFNGWNANSSGTGTSYTNQQSVTNLSSTKGATVTLYAQWNFGSVTLPTPTREGYTFGGWYTDSACTASAGAAGASYTPTENITLYAKWTANSYTVKFHANGGSGTMADQGFTYDTAQALTANGFTKTGYTFIGWATTAEGSVDYTDKQSVINLTATANGTFNLYAIWSANSYTVVFNANGSAGTMANQSFTYDQAQNLTANAFTRTGYTFDGWATTANDEAKYADKASVSNLTAEANGTVTLYAKWKTVSYNITFDTNGGNAMAPVSYNIEQTFTLQPGTRAGYKFLGWKVDAGSGNWVKDKLYQQETSISGMYGNVTLVAVWELATADLTVNVSGLDADQSIILSITGTRKDNVEFKTLLVSVVADAEGKGTVVIGDLPVGIYDIQVLNDWSWRYHEETVNVPFDGAQTVSFVFVKSTGQWLNDYDAE